MVRVHYQFKNQNLCVLLRPSARPERLILKKFLLPESKTTTDPTPNKEKIAKDQKDRVDSDIAINNYGQNLNLKVNQTKFRNVPKNSLKNILFWNEALPLKLFGLIFVGEFIYVI